MTKSLLKMEEAQIVDVCKIRTIKIEDFDEADWLFKFVLGNLELKMNY